MSFPINERSPLRFPGPLPAACDVVVIGGGIIGVMAAWHLAERGLSVTVCEKGRIAGEQSSRNWGWIRQQGRDPAELPIMVESLRQWERLAKECGDALGFRQTGVMYLANSAKALERFEAWLPHARENGIDSRMLSRKEVAGRLAGSQAHWPGALFTASDARAEPSMALSALVTGAIRRGVTVIEGCAVRALDRTGGHLTGVITERGRIGCEQVVLAGGAWSSLFARAEGISFPQLSVLSSVAATEPMAEIFPGAAADKDFAWRRREDGGYSLAPGTEHDLFIGPDALRHAKAYLPVLRNDWRSTHLRPTAPSGYPDAWATPRRWAADERSPFEAARILNPKPNMGALRRAQDAFARAFPSLGRPKLRMAWAGMIDTMPDVVPVIDRVATIPGLMLATGMSGHGFGIGPAIGRVIADLVTGNATGHDLHRFRLSRFSDGTQIGPGSSL